MWKTMDIATAMTDQEENIITLESIASQGTVLPAVAPQGKGNKHDRKCKIQKNLCEKDILTKYKVL